jgi:hypothetical protein
MGLTATVPRWTLEEGRSGGALTFHTYVLLANPGQADVTITSSSQERRACRPNIPRAASSRFTVDVRTRLSSLENESFGADIAGERSMYGKYRRRLLVRRYDRSRHQNAAAPED